MRKMKSTQENQEDSQNNPSNEDQENENKDQKIKERGNRNKSNSDYDIDEYKLDEQLVDTDNDKQSNEQIIQKKDLNNLNIEYKIFTNEYDEITKAENLEKSDEALKLSFGSTTYWISRCYN